jgi:hypothetical protein
MNFYRHGFYGVLFLACAFGSLRAQTAPPPPSTSKDSVTSIWSGVRLRVAKVNRLDAQAVILAIHVIAGDGAARPTFIGFQDKTKPLPGKPPLPPKPYSLSAACIVDKATQKQYGAVAPPNGQPTYGPQAIIRTMVPGNWFQLSVQFNLPPPTPNPDGTVPVQKVDLTLPQATGPIKDMVVPPVPKK